MQKQWLGCILYYMKRLKQRNSPYQIKQDIRKEHLRFGKYLYLLIIAIIIIILVNILFGHLYIAKGSGFIYSHNTLVELEYDAKVTKVLIKDGQYVKKGQPLFLYRSIELENLLKQALLDQQKGQEIKNQLVSDIAKVKKQIAATENYLAHTQTVNNNLEDYRKKGYISILKVAPEKKRYEDARANLHQYQLDLEQYQTSLKNIEKEIQGHADYFQLLTKKYNNGVELAPASGVIASLNTFPGQVLQKSETAMRLFDGEHYVLAYFDQRSWVSIQVGNRVVMDLPGNDILTGRITKILPISERLPEEFQPRFKSIERQQLVKIEADPEVLNKVPIMTTVKLYRPVGLDTWFRLKRSWSSDERK